MNKDLISVVIPVYNVKKYVEKCVETVIKQTYQNLEIILVDDGSTDNSGIVCDNISKKDKRIKVIHKKNGGLSDARNFGINNSNGKYICFIDSDDYVSIEYVEKLYEAIVRENADISACDFFYVDEVGITFENSKKKSNRNYTNIEALQDMLSCKQLIEVMTWNKLYKKSLFVDNKIEFPVGKIHEDNFTTYKLFYYAKKITLIADKLYYYLQRNDSIMGRKFNAKRLDILQAVEETKDFFEKNNVKEIMPYYNAYNYLTKRGIINNMIKNHYDILEIKKLRKDIKKQLKKIMFSKIVSLRVKEEGIILAFNLKVYSKLFIYGEKSIIKNIRVFLYKLKSGIKIINKYKKYRKSVNREAILFATPAHGNIGDHAITIAEMKLLEDIGVNDVFEISSFERFYAINYISQKVNKNAIIMVNGGGFMGSQWLNEEKTIRDVVKYFPNNEVIVFPQTAYYKDDEEGKKAFDESFEIYNNHKHLTLCAREEKTYNFFMDTYKNANILYVPDIVLYLKREERGINRNGVLLCLRKDPEKNTSNNDIINKTIKELKNKYTIFDSTDTVVPYSILPKDRNEKFQDKLREFSKYNVIITDRLHGMIFAYLTRTPCIVFGNYNYKVEGVYQWIKDCKNIIFVKNEEDLKNINNFVNIEDDDFKLNEDLFNKLKEILRKEEKDG